MINNVYKVFREERIKQGMSQKKLGELVGVPQQVINRLEQGQRKIDLELLEKLCIALKIYRISSHRSNSQTDYLVTGLNNVPIIIETRSNNNDLTEEEIHKVKEYIEFLKMTRSTTEKS